MTPQVPSSTSSFVEPTELDDQLKLKHRILTQGHHLSEIGEEPINVLSTEQNQAPSVERDISRISSNNSSSTKQIVSAKIETTDRKFGGDTVTKVNPDNSATLQGPREDSLLPPATKKYTLVLDLDETLIHSHVQYKQDFKSRAQQQEYFSELAQKFYDENKRQPTKEELENLALEMVFNIRPFAEEFLNSMAQEFEIVVFTAGEQDVSALADQTFQFVWAFQK